MVDQSVSKDPVEPGDNVVLVPDRIDLGQALGVRVLKDVLRGGVAVDSPPQERQELPVVLGEQLVGRRGRHGRKRCGHVGQACHSESIAWALRRNRQAVTFVSGL